MNSAVQFGASVDVGANRAVVGAPRHPAPSGGALGAVYIFERAGGSWVQQAILGDTTFWGQQGWFGQAVSLDGDQIGIGAPQVPFQFGHGAAVVFKRVGTTWSQEAVIVPPSSFGDQALNVGAAIDLRGDTLLIGSPALAGWSVTTPRAYVYVRTPSGWQQESKLGIPASGKSEAYFGTAVLLLGAHAFVGSRDANGLSSGSGAVYVYERVSGAWLLRQTLQADDGQPGDRFGFSLAGEAGKLLVGAQLAGGGLTGGLGGAYVFELQGGQWKQVAKLAPFGPFGWTGAAAGVSNDVLVLGSPTWPVISLFSFNGSRYLEHVATKPPGAQPASGYGSSIALSGGTLAVGAPYDNSPNGVAVGAVYMYAVDKSTLIQNYFCVPKVAAPGCTPVIVHVGEPSVSGAGAGQEYSLFAFRAPTNVKGMLFYSKAGPASLPYLGGTLCLAAPIVRTPLQASKGSGTCFGWFGYDFNAWIASGNDPALVAGQQVWFQYWYREPALAPPGNVGLTAGVSAILCP